MLSKNAIETVQLPSGLARMTALPGIQICGWQLVAFASFFAGIGSGWWALADPQELLSPFVVTAATMLLTFAGWYVWGFFVHLTDSVLFGGRSDYRETLDAFGWAYAFQTLAFLTFTRPLSWLWGWIALYATVVAWGVIGPRRQGMRTWQALVAATLGLLLWLACLLILTLTVQWDGWYIGVGAFLI